MCAGVASAMDNKNFDRRCVRFQSPFTYRATIALLGIVLVALLVAAFVYLLIILDMLGFESFTPAVVITCFSLAALWGWIRHSNGASDIKPAQMPPEEPPEFLRKGELPDQDPAVRRDPN